LLCQLHRKSDRARLAVPVELKITRQIILKTFHGTNLEVLEPDYSFKKG
jgi:hypothetical protein